MVFVTIIKVIHLILCVLLIGGVLFMNQKSEGLSGIMGGMSQSMRGVKGMDAGMRRMITNIGIAFGITSVVLGVLG